MGTKKSSEGAKHCSVSIYKKKIFALVDSGADVSVISFSLFEILKSLQPNLSFQHQKRVKLISASGHGLHILGSCILPVQFGNEKLHTKFFVVKNFRKPIILGSDFLQKNNAKWDFEEECLRIGDSVVLLKTKSETQKTRLVYCLHETVIPAYTSKIIKCYAQRRNGNAIISPLTNACIYEAYPGLLSVATLAKVKNCHCVTLFSNETDTQVKIKKGEILARADVYQEKHIKRGKPFDVNQIQSLEQKAPISSIKEMGTFSLNFSEKLSHLNSHEKQKFRSLLETNSDLFAKAETDLGKTSLVKMRIQTTCASPIKQKPYNTPFSQRPLVESQIDELLKANIIRESNSPWASPIIMVPKKDGGHRMCVDFRKLNQVTNQNSYPLPNISDILSSIKSAKVFSCLDLKSGYYQIEMQEEDKPKTAFVCFKGLYEFNVLPFGLSAAPPVFQELMNKVLKPALNKYAFAYLDDIIIFSENFSQHIAHVQEIFSLLRKAGLKLKLSKCNFGVDKVKYLGHEISSRGITPDPEKIKVIKKLKRPYTVREARSFLGMAGYYRRFVKNFADIAFPLTQLTRKYGRFKWTEECQESFEKLKQVLCETVVLAHPDTTRPYNLYTDASDYAVGAVLTQELEGGERVVQFLSKKLDEGRRKWATIEKEAYAIVYAVNKLRPFLFGSKFTVFTDHKPLRTLFTSEMKNARIQRWAIMLSEYGCNIEYKKGKENIPADMLSRIYDPENVDVIDNSDSSAFETPKLNDENPQPEGEPKPEINLDCLKNLSQLQKDDKHIQEIRDLLSSGHELNEYVMSDGLVYHIVPRVDGDRSPRLQVMIPESVKRVVLEQLHCSQFGGGHMGFDKTYQKIRERYFWPNMYRDTHQFVSRCDLCNERKRKQKSNPILSMPIPNYPFEIIGIDTCGPFTETENGNVYVLTVIDHFSGWPEAFPMKDKSTLSVARLLLNEIIPRHGCPRVMISDRGTEFVSAVVSLLNEKMRISHVKTSPYHPQSNGKTERFHRYMNDALAKYSRNSPFEWDLYLPAMLMAYRTMTHGSTKKSPFLVMYGRDPILPVDTLLQPKMRYMGDEYVPTQLQRLHEVYTDVRQNIEASQERNQENRNRNASCTVFTAGDAVYYRDKTSRPGISLKLQPRWVPFYRVIEQTGPVNYRIKHQVSGISKIVHVDNLMRAFPEENWERQWEDYSRFTSNRTAVDRPVLRRQPVRSAKLALPTVLQPSAAPNNAAPLDQSGAALAPVVLPTTLQKTDGGWEIQNTRVDSGGPSDQSDHLDTENGEKDMDIDVILELENATFPIRFI